MSLSTLKITLVCLSDCLIMGVFGLLCLIMVSYVLNNIYNNNNNNNNNNINNNNIYNIVSIWCIIKKYE